MIDFEKAAKTIRTIKANLMTEGEFVDNVIVHISEPTPNFSTPMEQHAFFLAKAEELENVLCNSLPAGLYDRLLASMLRRKASHLVFAHGEHDELPD